MASPEVDSEIELLIGLNVPKALEPLQVIPSVHDGPYTIKTILGWTVNGPLGDRRNRLQTAPDHCQFMDLVARSTELVDGHYRIGLPSRKREVNMPNNRRIAEQRALNLRRRFNRDASFHVEYTAFLDDISKGYAQRVPAEDLERTDGRVWYLPHHGISHPKKNMIRVVFDCAATFQGTSLNNQLLQGPDRTSPMIGVMIRFRKEPIAIIADIQAMFHQVRVPPEDSDFLRFLWLPNGDFSQDLVEYRMSVHLFGATSSPSCATFALRKCAEDN